MSNRGRGGRGGGGGHRGRDEHGPGKNAQSEAAVFAFSCDYKHLQAFSELDPFNPGNKVEGFVCRADGPMFGSLFITAVNHQPLTKPQLIYGVPRVNFLPSPTGPSPRSSGSPITNGSSKPNSGAAAAASSSDDPAKPFNPFLRLPPCSRFFLANKWNGFPVTFYKYTDSKNAEFVTVKNKAFPFVKDISPQLATLTVVKHLFKVTEGALLLPSLPVILAKLAKPAVQSITFEICGNKHPQLVKYGFEEEPKPIFITTPKGELRPLFGRPIDVAVEPAVTWTAENIHDEVGPEEFDPTRLAITTADFRSKAYDLNKDHREKHNLAEGYTFNNFVVEGKVLYLLDEDDTTVSRDALFKIKPKDIEQNHWPVFDSFLQGKVMEALEKLGDKEAQPTPENLQKEMDLDDRQWSRFQKEIMEFASQFPNPRKADPGSLQKMLVLVGLPGSGKSTIATRLAAHGWVRVNQDEMGSRQQCEAIAAAAFKKGQSVVVDRCNFDVSQRNHFVRLATKHHVSDIRAVLLDIPAEVCKQRIAVRKNHPTIPEGDSGWAIIDKFGHVLLPPRAAEGFNEVSRVQTQPEIDAMVEKYSTLLGK